MRPYVWQGPFIPVLPNSLEELVHSPGKILLFKKKILTSFSLVPYVIGTQKLTPATLKAIEKDCLILDINKDTLTLPAVKLPNLPREEQL